MRTNKYLLISFSIIAITVFSLPGFVKTVKAQRHHFDSYGDISRKEERIILDNYYVYLRQQTDSIAYIAFYVGKKDTYEKAKARINRVINHLTKVRALEKERIVIIYAGKWGTTRIMLEAIGKEFPVPKFGLNENKIVTSEFKS